MDIAIIASSEDGLPEIVEVKPDLEIRDETDKEFFSWLDNALTDHGKSMRDSGRNWRWAYAGQLTSEEAAKQLKRLGDGWSMPKFRDSSIGAMNGIRFAGPNLIDNSSDWVKKPHAAILFRGGILLFAFEMAHDTGVESCHHVYFVKK